MAGRLSILSPTIPYPSSFMRRLLPPKYYLKRNYCCWYKLEITGRGSYEIEEVHKPILDDFTIGRALGTKLLDIKDKPKLGAHLLAAVQPKG